MSRYSGSYVSRQSSLAPSESISRVSRASPDPESPLRVRAGVNDRDWPAGSSTTGSNISHSSRIQAWNAGVPYGSSSYAGSAVGSVASSHRSGHSRSSRDSWPSTLVAGPHNALTAIPEEASVASGRHSYSGYEQSSAASEVTRRSGYSRYDQASAVSRSSQRSASTIRPQNHGTSTRSQRDERSAVSRTTSHQTHGVVAGYRRDRDRHQDDQSHHSRSSNHNHRHRDDNSQYPERRRNRNLYEPRRHPSPGPNRGYTSYENERTERILDPRGRVVREEIEVMRGGLVRRR